MRVPTFAVQSILDMLSHWDLIATTIRRRTIYKEQVASDNELFFTFMGNVINCFLYYVARAIISIDNVSAVIEIRHELCSAV